MSVKKTIDAWAVINDGLGIPCVFYDRACKNQLGAAIFDDDDGTARREAYAYARTLRDKRGKLMDGIIVVPCTIVYQSKKTKR